MPTIIDSLIVKLGLDSKDLESKSPRAVKSLKDVDDQADKTEKGVKKISTTSKGTAEGFGSLSKAAGTFLALIGGTVAIKAMVNDFIESNAALERLSLNLGIGVSDISAWSQASERLGGSAAGLQGTLDMLSRSQTELMLTGQSSLIPYFASLGVSIGGFGQQARESTAILLDLADAFQNKIANGVMTRPTANNMLRMMGIDQGTANLILQGRKEIELTIARQKEHSAVTQKQAEEAQKLQTKMVGVRQSFEAFGRGLIEKATPALEVLLDKLSGIGDWINANQETVTDFLKVLAVGLGAIALAAIPLDPLVIAITAVAGAIALLWDDYQVWKRGGDSFIDWEKWEPGITAATKGIEKIGEVALGAFHNLSLLAKAGMSLASGNFAAASQAWKEWQASDQYGNSSGVPLTDVRNKPQTATAAQMQKYFQDRGMSADHAAGIAANLMSESGGRTNAVGDNGMAYGLGQWHPDRQADFANFAGHDIKLSTLDEQMAFVLHELGGTQARAGKALNNSVGAYAAGDAISRYYERPADADGQAARRGAYAQSLAGIPGASQVASQAPSGAGNTSTSSTDRSVTNSVGEIKIYTQATDAPGIAKDLGQSMDYLFASQANSGVW